MNIITNMQRRFTQAIIMVRCAFVCDKQRDTRNNDRVINRSLTFCYSGVDL